MPKMLVWIVCAAFMTLNVTALGQTTRKSLIEFGWDEPDTAFMRAHITEMEKLPFDGKRYKSGNASFGTNPRVRI